MLLCSILLLYLILRNHIFFNPFIQRIIENLPVRSRYLLSYKFQLLTLCVINSQAKLIN